uniref:Uncharacterized protein n=1 Tax=Picea sitchensis TaxID=3332 RepID=A9P1L3_PICSI|nr:unknown [Picea sitchensis]
MKISFSSLSINQISQMKSKSTTETSVLLGVYIVFQLAVLGSLLSTHSDSPSPSQLKSCGHGFSWIPLHVYLSALACLSTLLAFTFAFISETHLDFTQRRLLLLQNVSGGLVSTGDEDRESGRSPCSCSLSYKDYFSPYRLALSIYVLVFFVNIFNRCMDFA